MANVFDYLDWRGDLSLEADPFNDIDGLLLSCLSYVDLDGIVPAPGEGEGAISIRSAAARHRELHPEEERKADRSLIRFAPYILDKLAESGRFGEAVLKSFVDQIDPEEDTQFSALEIIPSDGIPFLSFRGTDDTLTGWKEDFNLSYMMIPSEKMALDYLTENRKDHEGPFRMGGHSKGGHLAVYAAAECPEEIRQQILAIYDNDGPGFNENVMRRDPNHPELYAKIHRIIPEDSVIGMLMWHPVKPVICSSSAKGVLQHDPTSWEVVGKDFVKKKSLGRIGRVMKDSFSRWIEGTPFPERQAFVEDLFTVLEASGTPYVSHMQDLDLKALRNMWKALEKTSRSSREKTEELLSIFKEEWKEALSDTIRKRSPL